jgi:hypothetical protein
VKNKLTLVLEVQTDATPEIVADSLLSQNVLLNVPSDDTASGWLEMKVTKLDWITYELPIARGPLQEPKR